MLQELEPLPGLSILNRRPKVLPGPKYLHHLVCQAPATDAPAIDFLEEGSKRRQLTYQALHAASDALAKRIRAHLAGLETASAVIPILLPQSPELYVALLAVLKAGRAFCPIGLDLPSERVDFILKDISAGLVITDGAFEHILPESSSIQTLLVHGTYPALPPGSELETPQLLQTRLAYVLYTSGSTGLPKAVSVSHRAVTQSLLAHDRHIPSFSRFLQFAAPTFDVSIFEIFFPLYRGCTIVGRTRTHMLNDLPGTIASLEVDAAELTPTVVSNLLRGRKSVPCLKLLLTIGEMLTRDVVDEFGGNETKPSVLFGMYGPTEAAIHCTLQPGFPCSSPLGNIGFPLETVTALIAAPAPHGGPVQAIKILPTGETGELIIGGPQVADGYLNRPELTSASFIQDQEFGLLYRTGDKARICADGTLECLGRIVSGQVKLRGQRVELGEVEQTIRKVHDCYGAVAMVIEDTLVAFCATDSASVSSTTVLQKCRRWLPSYMVPADIIFLDRMPQLPSGKVDKKSLEAHFFSRFRQFISPGSPSCDEPTHILSSIFQSTLGRDISDNEDFTNTGLDSLQSIRIASSIREHGFDVDSVDILSSANLGELKNVCMGRKKRHPNPIRHVSIETSLASSIAELQAYQDDIVDILPCTPLQDAMLTENAVRPSAYCNWVEVELSDRHTFGRIQEVLRILVQQNEILRTGFCMTNIASTSFLQVVWKDAQPALVVEVNVFSRAYSLGSAQSLLRPFSVQVITATERPRLLFQIHHAIYDGWSFDLLLRDFNQLIDGRSIAPRPQFRQVVDYCLQASGSKKLEKSTEHWRRTLHEYHPMALPNFNGRTMPFSGLRSLRGVSAVDQQSLFAYAKEHAIHPQVFYQAAITHILGQYLGVSDVVVGTVTSGRTIPVTHIEDIIGPCIASLPFRMDLSDCSTVGNLLQRTHQANRDMLEHCIVPLRDITKLCHLRPGERLFDILFVWQESLVSADNRNLALRTIDSADDLEFKITLEFEPRGESTVYRATYDPSIIPEQQVEYLMKHIDHTVQSFLSEYDGKLSQAKRLLDPRLLSIANPRPEKQSIYHGPAHSIEKWAVETPDKDAIIVGSMVDGKMEVKERSTYASLNARANQLARALIDLGAVEDQLICVMLEKSIDLYVSILAILKTGCGYLPIVPDTPAERIKRILADARVHICISGSSSLKDIQLANIVTLDPATLDVSRYTNGNLSVPYKGDHLAYAVFTSGSTGKPKGVLVTQDNLMSNLEYLSSLYPYGHDSRLLQSCSQAFDVSVFEIFFSWHVGMCLCTAAKDDLFYDFETAIDSLDITHLSLTPTVAGLVDPDRVPKVKFLVTAGEALTEGVKRKWAGKGLYQGYGPSETTNICTVNPLVTDSDLINNIGPVFPNTSLLVLEPGKDEPVPRGAIGELCFGGAQVFRGYLNRADLNAQKILQHPTYGRIYRSGDMGRLLPDDSILFTGRLDDQVKIRGQRVELGEITSIVLDHPCVHDCSTVLIEDDHGSQKLIVFWVPKGKLPVGYCYLAPDKYRVSIIEIFESLSLQLPAYMIPTYVVPITSIPMTPQAKIDRRLLRQTFVELANENLSQVSLSSATENKQDANELSASEKKISEGLSQTLNLRPADIKRNSSFFSLGLDSISAIRFAKLLREAGMGHIPVSVILKNPTLERLSLVLMDRSDADSVPDSTMAVNVFDSAQRSQICSEFPNNGLDIEKILPCTPLQEAMLSSGSPDGASYHNLVTFTVTGDLERLKSCWESMISRHEILRTTFMSTDNSQYAFAQIILKHVPVTWEELDSEKDLSAYVGEVLTNLLLSRRPPLQLAIQNDGLSAKLIFCCHHALYDGVAMGVLLNEIQALYLEEELPTAVPYEMYLRHVIKQDLEAAHRFWAAALAQFEPTFFPDLSGNVSRSSKTASLTQRVIQVPLSSALKYSRDISASLLSLVQAAWVKVLHSVLAETDLCFGNVVSGRTLPEDGLDRLVAPCFNTIPIRLNFDFQRSNVELCKKLHSINVDVLPFQLTPLRWIQSKARQDQGHLFDTLVILQQPSTPLKDSIWSLDRDEGEMDLPVVCEVTQDKDKDTLTLNLHHYNVLCQKDDAAILAGIFDYAFHSLIHFPDSAAEDTIGLPSYLLSQSNMDFRVFEAPRGGLLHSAFEHNAAGSPDVAALEFRHSNGALTTLTFLSLNERANQIAYALVQLGVKPEDVIPVHMSKSPEFYISILGVLKAGAAFSPIHPDLPVARKQFMVFELNPKAIISVESVIDWVDNVIVVDIKKTEDNPTDNLCIGGLTSTNTAYCLYTSGSTGLPKAVSMEHRSPLQTIESSRSLIPWEKNSRLLQYAAITFDMCYYDCFLAWTFGFTLCAADQDLMLNDLADTINALHVDLLDLTPSVATTLRRTQVPRVKWLYCIGESMTSEVVTEWPGACVNSYGPTEAAFCTTIFPTAPESKTSVIGKPFSTTSFAIFPPHGERPLPILGAGELYIGGAQLARGYHNQPQLTEERFLYKCGQRFYKSGDVVRMLRDGNFEFLGRTDDQVKIRGLRVELGEINKILQESDEKIFAVSTQILKKGDGQKDQLVAFLVIQRSADESERSRIKLAAKQKATDTLPSYMVPQFFLFIDKIPKSMAGKVDKRALTSIFRESTENYAGLDDAEQDAAGYAWNEREELIRDIFSKLSSTPHKDIKPWTTIYQIGLDSISAVQIAAALRKHDMQANVADVMKYMSCQGLAAHLTRSSGTHLTKAQGFNFDAFEMEYRHEAARTLGVSDELIEAIRPCTPLQNGILSQFIAKEGGVYFNYLRLRLENDIDLDRLRDAWLATARKHRMLRTGFTHVRNNLSAFAMIHYRPGAESLPWQVANKQATTTEEWLRDSEREVLKRLHRPPWHVRLYKENGITYLDVALLHAIFDAQSLSLIFGDIEASYEGKETLTIPLEPVIDGILHLSTSENVDSDKFWKQTRKVAVPTRFPNLAPLRYNPAPSVVIVKSSSRTLEELDAGCRTKNTSLQAASIAAWATLLSAYVGESSVTFGVVLSGRNIDGADAAVFPCITTVPFPCKVVDNLDEMLRDVMSMNAEIQQHQFTPLNNIQKLTGYPNEPLFDSIFAFQKLANNRNSDGLWTVVDERASIEYPLSIELEPKHGQLELRLTFLPHVIPKEQAHLILEQLDHLIQRYIFLAAGSRKFRTDLYSITPANTPTIPSEAKLLHEFVELTASKYPDRIAFEFATSLQPDAFSSRKWTYEQFDAEGNRIANVLISQGVRPGELVGICFDKCPEASFAILGILKAGCAFVALDPGAPSARKAFILKDSGAHIVLSTAFQSANFKENTSATILNVDEIDWHSASSKKQSLERIMDPQDRSYCLYTSGTTGAPKGCEITHENAVQAMQAFSRLFSGHWDSESRWLQFASFHFDVSVLEQYWSWSVGICVVSAPRDLIFEDIASSIRTLQITHIDLTPSLARILHPDDVPSLCKGVFITGGESLKQDILDVWGPKSVIYNGYGPTEATIGVTMYPRVPANGKPSNIGPQFDNVGSYVLQPGSDVPVLRGGIGELCVAGKLVGKGYLNRPDLTKERFAYLERFNERVYRTGDLVRILYDGTFDFLGRADDQVKLRGQRLEIGEINSVIKQCGITVADVATLILKHPKQQKEQLVSFIVIGSGTRGEAQIVLEKSGDLWKAREACQEKLPPYMVPTHFVAVNTMPLSANNKVEGRMLKKMYEALPANDLQLLSSGTRPKDEKWTRQEESVRDVLMEVLNIDGSFMKDTSFFELGMDSISVIGVSKALQTGFPKAAVSTILKNSTVRRLTKALLNTATTANDQGSIIAAQQAITAVRHRHRRDVAEILCMDTRNVEALARCTPLQAGMIARSLDSKHGLYFNCFRFHLHENVDLAKLQDAWKQVFASTQILRTVFVNTEDGFMQTVLRNLELPFDTVTLPQADVIECHLRKKREEWVRHNRIHTTKPIELCVAESSEGRLFVVHIFHGLYDGNSIGLLFKSVLDAYNDRKLEGRPAFHSALPYGPLRPIVNATQFWEKHLVDRRFKPVFTLSDRPIAEPVVVIREVQPLPYFDTTRRKLNVTAQAIAQACWTYVLHQHSKSTVTIGMVLSGRNIDFDGADNVIGPLFNTIPHQFRAQPRETWKSLVTRAHDFNVAAHPYQHTPLRDILKLMKRRPNQPLFDTLFVYQITDEQAGWTKNELWELQDAGAEADYPLAIEVEQSGSGALKLTLVAQSHVITLDTAGYLLERYEDALRSVIKNPDAELETFDEGGESAEHIPFIEAVAVSDTFDGTMDFKWTNQANAIRKEIATLAGVEVEEIKANTSIFELGLDSIDAIKLSSKLKKHGIELPVSGIMRSLSIAGMVERVFVDKEKKIGRPSDMIYQMNKKRLEAYLRRHELTEGVEQVLPLTPLQDAMVTEMVASEYARYYNHDVLKLKADVSIKRLKEAWTEVIKRSPILRTSFITVDDPGINFSHAQAIHYAPHAFWRTILLDNDPDFPAIFDNIRNEAVAKRSSEPLFTIHLVQSSQQSYLVLSIAHALYDGWSLGLLHSDVHHAYAGNLQLRPSYEPALYEILTTSGPDAAAFWRDYLCDTKPAIFPRRAGFNGQSYQSVHRKQQMSHLTLDTVASFAKKHSITLQTLGQAVHGLTVASYTKSLDVTFGLVLSGRDDELRSKLLFPTMNTVATRTILYGNRRDTLQYVQDNFSNIKQFQHFPLRKALSLAGSQRPLLESLFIYQKSLSDEAGQSKNLYESIQSRSDVEYPVCVEMEIVGKDLVWRCAVKAEVFDDDGAQKFLDTLDEVLNAIITQPDAPVIDFVADGTSICGLPAFTSGQVEATEKAHLEVGTQDATHSTSPTRSIIREVLAFVSQTPEEEITPGMTIFHIGLDSISAIKVTSLLRKRGITLSVGEMLRAGTVEEMARIVDERAPEADSESDNTDGILKEAPFGIDQANLFARVGVREEDVERVLPATAGQIYMLSTWVNSHGAVSYPEFKYRIHGSVSCETIQKAWKTVVAQNSILRTLFYATNNEYTPYIQAVMRNADARAMDTTGFRKNELAELKTSTASKHPYARLFVSRQQPLGPWDVQLSIHHGLYDGVSLPIIIQQLQDLCNGKYVPAAPTHVLSQVIATASNPSAIQQRKAFWTKYLRGVDQHHLPQPSATPTSRIEVFRPGLLPNVQDLGSQAHKHGLTAQSVFLAACAKLYAGLTATPPTQDVIIGLYLANRSLPIANLHQIAIPTVNLVPLRVSTPLESNVFDAAMQIQYDILEISAPANASTSLWEIYEWTGVKVDTFVNFLKLPGGEDDVGEGIVKVTPVETWREDSSRVVEIAGGVVPPEEIVDKRVNGAYLHALDIEATIREGRLDVGVFAPVEMMRLEEGEELMGGIRRELEGCRKSAE